MDADRDQALQRDYWRWHAQFLQNRRELAETALWEGPALAMTAQAFLLTISLGANTPQFGRIVSSLLALSTASAAIYMICRKRKQGENYDTELWSVIERLHQYKPPDLD